jgi:putative membrane protein
MLTEPELARIEAAIREAERGTSAEIVVAVAAPHHGTDLHLWPAAVALAAPLPVLIAAPRLPGLWLYAIQLGVLALALALLLVPAAHRYLASPAARQARTRRLAREQFFERGLHRTAARTGVLLFLSPGDRCAEIISDAGVEGPLPDEAWRPCLDGLLAEAGKGRLAEGIVTAVGRMGEMLRERLPAGPGDRDEIPNRPVVL